MPRAQRMFLPRDYTRISKFLSYNLRHGNKRLLQVDGFGWVWLSVLQLALRWSTLVSIEDLKVVAEQQTSRFQIERIEVNRGMRHYDYKVRAIQGHTTIPAPLNDYALISPRGFLSKFLIHFTSAMAWNDIWSQGLSAMTRQFIHLRAADPSITSARAIRPTKRKYSICILIDASYFCREVIPLFETSNGTILCPAEYGHIPSLAFHAAYLFQMRRHTSDCVTLAFHGEDRSFRREVKSLLMECVEDERAYQRR